MQNLNGVWQLATDPDNVGRTDRWFEAVRAEAQEAPVPGVIQQVVPGYHGVVWYWHSFDLAAAGAPNERILLKFGAVDYLAEVWLNGKRAGSHEGGETPFELDVTELAHTGPGRDNLLAVRVLNPTDEPIDGIVLKETPHRNKLMTFRPGSGFNIGGIMYPVTVRRVPPIYVTDLFAQPDAKTGVIALTVRVRNVDAAEA